MANTDESGYVSEPTPRLCFLRRDEGERYGFNLTVERGSRGHLVRKLASRGAAERSGLRDGDRVLEVNGFFVDDVSQAVMARRIRISGNQLCVLVLDQEGYERARAQGDHLLPLVKSHEMKACKAPRLCHVTRNHSHSGLGVSFNPVEGEKGHFSVGLVHGGAAEKAGLRRGDRLVWMNGAAVSDLTHSALTKMVKKCGDHITLLVVDSETEKKYVQQKWPILPAMAVPCNLPHRARSLALALGPHGYGFLLKEGKTSSGRTVHVVQEVHDDSPAQRAGMQAGELLLEVDWESVESLAHKDVVERVKQSSPQITLTIISAQGLDFYSKLGLSPVLFCGDEAGGEKQERDSPLPSVTEETPEQVVASLCASLEDSVASLSATSEEVVDGLPAQRHCVIEKGPLGFGLDFDSVQHTSGTVVSQVTPGGPGHRAGLAEGEVVVEVNGHNVERKYLEDVLMLVKAGGKHLSLVVKNQSHHSNDQDQTCSGLESHDSEEEAGDSFL
ncbi:NHERF family PDZ scaffold protein 4b [Gadus macrocephalus]|uniref:NHERF family PDZ scaffold protein 4b n=1 Tax=Gadus macrocephalus TaxID=80720 RepID=UPI0028CB3199|nr:NHERF family PDZ scaffold protein 4b [Gadus macrocephalus]